MGHVSTFFNTEISHSGTLAALGDACFAPIRYFLHGKTVDIDKTTKTTVIHSMASYHPEAGHRSRVFAYLLKNGSKNYFTDKGVSQEKHLLATVGAIVALVPCFFLGLIFKSLAYLSSTMRERHNLAKLHLTPSNMKIGTQNIPLDQEGIRKALEERIQDPGHQKVDALIIHGRQEVTVSDTDDQIRALNPRKIILIGPRGSNRHDGQTDEGYQRLVGMYEPPIQKVRSIEEALKAKPEDRSWLYGGGSYQMMYQVN
jgi:hypothetical protein